MIPTPRNTPKARSMIRQGNESIYNIQQQLSNRILALTDNGEEIIQFFLGTMRAQGVDIRYRLAAARWLADRSWGKEPEVVHINTGGIFEALVHASDEELTAIVRGANATDLPLLADLGREWREQRSVQSTGSGDFIEST